MFDLSAACDRAAHCCLLESLCHLCFYSWGLLFIDLPSVSKTLSVSSSISSSLAFCPPYSIIHREAISEQSHPLLGLHLPTQLTPSSTLHVQLVAQAHSIPCEKQCSLCTSGAYTVQKKQMRTNR